MPQDRRPPRLMGLMAPCSYSRLFFFNQLPTSNFIETPDFNSGKVFLKDQSNIERHGLSWTRHMSICKQCTYHFQQNSVLCQKLEIILEDLGQRGQKSWLWLREAWNVSNVNFLEYWFLFQRLCTKAKQSPFPRNMEIVSNSWEWSCTLVKYWFDQQKTGLTHPFFQMSSGSKNFEAA